MRHLEKICLYSLTVWFVGCSSSFNADRLSGAGSANSNQSKTAQSSTAKPEDAVAEVNSEQAKVGQNEVEVDSAVTAVPPQMVTGAYLVCANVAATDTQAMSEISETFTPTDNKIYSCGIQTSDRIRHPAQTRISAVQVQCASEENIWPPEMVEAPATSAWGAYFQVPMTRACELERIMVEVVINGEPASMETKLSDLSMPMPPETYHLLFVTSDVYGPGADSTGAGRFDSLADADKICVRHAQGSPITNFKADWKAILSDDATDVKSRVSITQNVLSTYDKMQTLFDVSSDSSFWQGISVQVATESGTLLTDRSRVWTGSKDDGTAAGETCKNWGSGKDGDNGKFGLPTVSGNKDWIQSDNAKCNQKLRLYCISQPPKNGTAALNANPQAIEPTAN